MLLIVDSPMAAVQNGNGNGDGKLCECLLAESRSLMGAAAPHHPSDRQIHEFGEQDHLVQKASYLPTVTFLTVGS